MNAIENAMETAENANELNQEIETAQTMGQETIDMELDEVAPKQVGAPVDKKEGGFTLIELMITIAIIAILAGMAIPAYSRYQAKAYQTEAKQALNHIRMLQEVHYAENGTYGADAAAIGFAQQGTPKYTFAFVITDATLDYQCTATANIDNDATIDTWTVDQTGDITNTINDVNT